jgi:SAM-dependent methyltransferase
VYREGRPIRSGLSSADEGTHPPAAAVLTVLRSRLPLATRAEADELLESGRLSDSEVEANLTDLARLNRLPGGAAASLSAIGHLANGSTPRIVDVGTGAADLPLAFARRGWPSVAIDTHPGVLRFAQRMTAGAALVEVREADAAALPFDDRAFDVAHSSLLIHHLAPAEAIGALREMRRVARLGVVVNDLRRGIFPLAATAASVFVLGRSHVTRTDGIISARRAYTLSEIDALLASAGLRPAWRSNRWMPRVVTAAVRA